MRRLLYLVTEDWYFRSHRLPLALAARDAGWHVSVATRCGRYGALLREHGLEVFDLPFERSMKLPLRDLASYRALRRLLREHAFDVIHAVSLKPILLGLLAAPERRRCIAAFTGLGYIFSSSDRRARVLRRVVQSLLRYELSDGAAWTLVQNADDAALLADAAIGVPARTVLIPGVGVELASYPRARPAASQPPLVVLPARVLVDKGVREFVAAARRLRAAGIAARFALVGQHDRDNPGAVPLTELTGWQDEGVVEWWGHREDMAAVYAAAAVVCLPSYREGLPKVLLEAAAVGRALVATDVPGCRDVVRDGVEGLVVPARDALALADALGRLLADATLRKRCASAARAGVEERFASTRINAQMLALYDRVATAVVSGTPA
ncbi:MAG: glycosyltransferase family 4 protein [Gammaproteobacteria bacterium]